TLQWGTPPRHQTSSAQARTHSLQQLQRRLSSWMSTRNGHVCKSAVPQRTLPRHWGPLHIGLRTVRFSSVVSILGGYTVSAVELATSLAPQSCFLSRRERLFDAPVFPLQFLSRDLGSVLRQPLEQLGVGHQAFGHTARAYHGPV